ncbi:MAG: pentapeptide repeat-containing protein [Candidatus Omnitrophota bacterium]
MFEESCYESRRFERVAAPGQDFSEKEFSKCEFVACDLSGAKLSGALLDGCCFYDCNLSSLKVSGAGFRQVTFEGCKLTGIAFNTINPFTLNWEFRKCKIEMCGFVGLKMKRSRFSDCFIHKTSFAGADLTGSDFSGSDLSQSEFGHTILEKCNFATARHYSIDPGQNRLRQARFAYPEVMALLTSFGIKVDEEDEANGGSDV